MAIKIVSMKRILIIGATGTVGRNVISQLIDANVLLRGLTRTPDSADLPAQVEIVRGDLTIPERADGRLALIDTSTPLHLDDGRVIWCGSDGGYCFRCTTGELTPDEAQREYPETRETPEVHTIHVTQERLLLDGGYVIPHDYVGEGLRMPSLGEALEHQLVAWLALPNGTYQVTVHHLRTAADDEDAEEDYPPDNEVSIVLTFARVADGV